MNRNQLLLISIAGALLVAIPASQAVWSKAHVPIDKSQVCHEGVTLVVKPKSLGRHLEHGDCRLPACDFNNVFLAGDVCPTGLVTGGFCDLASPRSSGNDITSACTPAF